MAKISGKNAVVIVNGYVFSTYATAYQANQQVEAIDVTGFGDGTHNFIPGNKMDELSVDMLWDGTATTGSMDRMRLLTAGGLVTILPEAYALGGKTINFQYMQQNMNAAGTPTGPVQLGSIKFSNYGSSSFGLEYGQCLFSGTITATSTGTAVADPYVTASDLAATGCSATMQITTAPPADTYVVDIQHSTDGSTSWSTIGSFAATGATVGAQRIVVAPGAIKKYRRYLATRTGAAGSNFSFTIHFWRDWSKST